MTTEQRTSDVRHDFRTTVLNKELCVIRVNYEPGFPHLFSNVGGNILHNSIYSWQTGACLGYNKTHIIVYNQILLALPSHYINTKIIFLLVKILDRVSLGKVRNDLFFLPLLLLNL